MFTVFRFQYVLCELSQKADYLPQRFEFSGRQILAGKDTNIVKLFDAEGAPIGYMLGIAVGPDGLFKKTYPFAFTKDDPEFWRKFEEILIDCAGRYTFFIDTGTEARLYCDPVGMNGVVYETQAHRIASSPLLAIDRPVIPNKLYDTELLAGHKVRYTLHHTCDEHVKRLNPNCFIDLKTFETQRFWPRDEDFALGERPHAQVYDQIIEGLAFNIDEITEGHPCVMPISGGRDSRILAAVGKKSLHKLHMFYTHVKNYASEVDAHVGAGVAHALKVPHLILGGRFEDRSSRWERKFLAQAYKISHASEAAPPKEYETGILKSIPSDKVILRGHQTDLLRAVFVFKSKSRWRRHGWQLERMQIVPRDDFHRGISEHFKEEFFKWQRSLPENAMEKAADFMFLEVYYNSSIGASFPGLWQHFYMSPFNSRRLISLSLSFEEAERRKGNPVNDIIQRCAPECARVPYYGEGGEHFPENLDPKKFAPLSGPRYEATAERLRNLYKTAAE